MLNVPWRQISMNLITTLMEWTLVILVLLLSLIGSQSVLLLKKLLKNWLFLPRSLHRIAKLESFMVASTSPSTPVVMKPAPYVPSSMQGWDDASAVSTNNILVDISSPPLQSTNSLAPIPQFVPIPPSNVVPSSSVDMEQCLLSLSNTVSSLAGSINKGIEQNNLILARQNGQANN
ncbi:unnamed protein product [Rhizophagus irregularis]|nr:unnamed protein product [Rhizophagus irregularis]